MIRAESSAIPEQDVAILGRMILQVGFDQASLDGAARHVFHSILIRGGIMSQPSAPPPAVKPPRSPVEKAIVWGVIGIGLVVIGVEAQAQLAHGAALEKLQTTLEKKADTELGMTKKDVDELMGAKVPEVRKLNPAETAMGAARVDVYSYLGLVRQRKIYVYYGVEGKVKDQQPEVMEVGAIPAETPADAAKRLPDPETLPKATGGAPGGGRGGMGAGGPPGGGRGGPPPAHGATGRPPTEGDAKPDAAAGDKKDEGKKDEAPAADKPAADKPAEEAKPADAKPEAEKPAEGEKKE